MLCKPRILSIFPNSFNKFNKTWTLMYDLLCKTVSSCYSLIYGKCRFTLSILSKMSWQHHLGANCIQNFHLGRYIAGYTVGNLVLWRRASGALKRDFRTYIRRYTSPNEILNMIIPILMHFCSLSSNWSVASRIKPHVIQRNAT